MPFQNPITGGAGSLVRPSIHSPNFVTGTAGWSINKDGSAEFNSAVIRGALAIGGVSPNARTVIGATPVPAELVTYYNTGAPATFIPPETVVDVIQNFDGQGNYQYQALVIDSSVPKVSAIAYGMVISGTVTEIWRITLNPSGGGSANAFWESAKVTMHDPTGTTAVQGVSIRTDINADRLQLHASGQISWGPGGTNKAQDTILSRTAAAQLMVDQLVANNSGTAETWHAVSFATNWSNAGGSTRNLQYRKTAFNEVQVIGTAHVGGTFTSTIATLPAGYRPTSQQGIWAWTGAGAGGQLVRVDSGGAMVVFGSSAINTDWWVNGTFTLDA